MNKLILIYCYLLYLAKGLKKKNHVRLKGLNSSYSSVDGKKCFDCVIGIQTAGSTRCKNFDHYTSNCFEEDDGFFIKYSIGDSTYFSCDEYGIAGDVGFISFSLINVKKG